MLLPQYAFFIKVKVKFIKDLNFVMVVVCLLKMLTFLRVYFLDLYYVMAHWHTKLVQCSHEKTTWYTLESDTAKYSTSSE
jgi:hypothetical protein